MVNFVPATEYQEQLLYDHFIISTNLGATEPQILYNPQTEEYQVLGGDVLLNTRNTGVMPLRFDRVEGNFYAANSGLKSLVGSPRTVTGYYKVDHNLLQDLQGAPDHVGGKFQVTYAPDLPLLRTLVASEVWLQGRPPEVVIRIMNKYAGGGKSVMLNAAMELKKAGYREHAKW